MMKLAALLAVLCFCGLAIASPRLIAQKLVLEDYIVLDEGASVVHRIFNVGSSSAYDVTLDDKNSEGLGPVVEGTQTAHWERIPPGGSVVHTFFTAPETEGDIPVGGSLITYRHSPTSQLAAHFTTAVGRVRVGAVNELAQLTSSRFVEWGIFSIVALAAIAVPFLRYSSLKAQYEQGIERGTSLHEAIFKKKKRSRN